MRILIIEDNEEINDILKEALTGAGYEAVQSFSGSEGLLRFSTEDFDMVLLDLMLPGIKGEEVLQKIKEKSDIPVLVLSAKTDIEGKVNLLRQGASDYITKPFDVREVLARIDLHAKNSGNKTVSNDLTYNEISINDESHVCSVNGNEISLTKHEFNLLRLLVLHPKRFIQSVSFSNLPGKKNISVKIIRLMSTSAISVRRYESIPIMNI